MKDSHHDSFVPKSMQLEKDMVMDGMYVANLFNRLRQLRSPSVVDQMRWPWELCQNAKDCIVGDPKHPTVDIEFYASQDEVIFRHNGTPFSGRSMYALLYKYSEGKENAETTGRFGTGFMTTITLSPVIEVRTDFIDYQKLIGFQATMYRDGDTKEKLLDGLRKMRESFKETDPDGYTTFTYKLQTDVNRDARDLGYESFKNYITQTLLFATTINSTKFKYFDNEINVKRGKVTKFEDISKIYFEVDSNSISRKRIFLMTSYNQPNDDLTKRFEQPRNLRLDVAVEIDENNNFIIEENKTCMYCTFPFVGSEEHQLPFILNSPDFEPDEERQSLLLKGEDFVVHSNSAGEKENVISIPKINKIILLKSIELFAKLLNFILSINGDSFYLLTNGILSASLIKNMDKIWYSHHFINNFRCLLSKSPIVNNCNGTRIELQNAYFPLYNSANMSHEQKEQLHELVRAYYGDDATCSFQESLNWDKRNWNELHFISILDLITLEEKNNNEYDDTHFEYLNQLIKYSAKYEIQLLQDYPIIPDMTLEKHSYNSNFSECKSVHDDMIRILDSLHTNWKKTHMHNKINGIKLHENYMKDAIDKCTQAIVQNEELSYVLVPYVLPNNNRRKMMYELTHTIIQIHLQDPYECQPIDESLWTQCDKYLINKMVSIISQFNQTQTNSRISDINQFLGFINNEPEKKLLNEYNLVPNKNNTLCKLFRLRDQSNISDEFKKVMKYCLNIDINDDEMNEQITEVKCKQQSTIEYYIDKIDTQFDKLTFNRKKELVKTIIKYLPDKEEVDLYEKQKKIQQLYIALISKSPDEIIPTNITKSSFWTKLNKFIIEMLLKPAVSKYLQFQDFLRDNNFSEEDGIEVLNKSYEFIHDGSNVPNQNGYMCEIQNLKCGKGIPQSFVKLIKYLKQIDYKDKVSDERVIHPNLQAFDFISFYDQANDALSKALEKEKYRNDNEIKKILAEMNVQPNNKSFALNFFSDSEQNSAQRKLLTNVYVANVKNRLKDLENPNENDKKRWGWELCQNAKDSISTTPEKRVKIVIIVSDDRIIFKHNGNPFTQDALLGLLYKFSEGKENNDKTTGKFGTGFLTTHILSRTVKLTSNFIESNGEIYRFSVTLDRRGSNKQQLIESVKRMEDSYKTIENEQDDFTIFEYELSTTLGKECAKLGLDSLKKELPLVLLFANEIESVTIEEKNCTTIYQLNDEKNQADENIKHVKCSINGNIMNKRFIFIQENVESQEFTKFKSSNSTIPISCALEIDEHNNIVSHKEQNSLYCSFPLIGSHEQLIPIIINSPAFEPLSERNGLRLQKVDNNIIDENVINKIILTNVVPMFQNIVNICIKEMICSLYLLTDGLINYFSSKLPDFDKVWYNNEFISKMRSILCQAPIIETENGFINLQDAVIPIYNLQNDFTSFSNNSSIVKDYYNLVHFIFPRQIITLDESKYWHNKTWKGLNRITLEDLIKREENSNEFCWEYINNLLSYTYQYDIKLIQNNSIIPDMNMQRHKFTPDIFFECKSVCDDLIEILEKIDSDWKSTHMHNKITGIKLSDHDMNAAIQEVNDIINNDHNKALIIVSYTNTIDKRRKKLFKLSQQILNNEYSEHKCQITDAKLWEACDSILITTIIDTIQNFESVSDKLCLINKFLHFLNTFEFKKLTTEKIIPNAKCELCYLSQLKGNTEINEQFKEMMNICFDKDINEVEIHPSITKIKCNECSTIDDYINFIDKNFPALNSEENIVCSVTLLYTFPNPESTDLSLKQQSLYSIFQKVMESDAINLPENLSTFLSNIKEEQTNVTNEKLWSRANKEIIDFLAEKISSFSLFSEFIEHYNFENENQAIEFLNQCYQYIPYGKNIPNLKGNMKSIGDTIYLSDQCPDDILEFINKIEKGDNTREILARHGIKHPKLILYEVSVLYDKMHCIYGEIMEDEKKRDDPEIKRALMKLNFSSAGLTRNYFNTTNMNEGDKEKLRLFSKIYIANVKTRLHELQSPSNSVKKRCFWELTQNAKDTVSDDPSGKVDIEIILNKNEAIFKHNGKEFTQSTMLGLLYKFSEGKEENEHSTGRFGTGFLTTHIISPIVHITGDVRLDDGSLNGFSVTLNRKGDKTKELLEGFNATEASRKMEKDTFGQTTFKYPFIHKNSMKYAISSLQNIKENLPFVLLFCKHLNKYKINHFGDTIEFTCLYTAKAPIFEIQINTNGNITKRRFIKYSIKEKSKELTELYNRERYIEIDVAVEINEKNEIIPKGNENLFCVFPLVGSENIKLPVVINSPDFETTTERDSIYLKKEKEDKISNVNKKIFQRSRELFQLILNYCCDHNFGALYNFARGLNKKPQHEDNFSPEEFKKIFIYPLRSILQEARVFLSSEGKLEYLKNLSIPRYSTQYMDETSDFQHDFYSILEMVKPNIVDFSVSIEWCKMMWRKFPAISFEDFINEISSYKRIEYIPLEDDEKRFNFMNEFIPFVKKYDPTKFEEIPILPNQNHVFVLESVDLALAPDVNMEIVDLIHKMGKEWKATHISLKIISKPINNIHTINNAEKLIQDSINKRNAWILMSYIIQDSERRETMYQIAKKLKSSVNLTPIPLNNFHEEIWDKADKIIALDSLHILEANRHITSKLTIEWLNDTILFFIKQKFISKYELRERTIFPNQKGEFVDYETIQSDGIIYEELKHMLVKYCDVDCRDLLLDQGFTVDKPDNELTFDYYADEINKLFTTVKQKESKTPCIKNGAIYYKVCCQDVLIETKKYDSKCKSVARILIKYINTNDSSLRTTQKKLLDIYNTVKKCSLDSIELPGVMNNQTFKYIKNCILSSIVKTIKHCANIKNMKNCLEIDEDQCLEILKYLYSLAQVELIPNQLGDFCSDIKKLYIDKNIDSKIKEFQYKFDPENDCRKLLVHQNIKEHPKLSMMINQSICKMIDEKIYSTYQQYMKKPKDKYRSLINELFEYIDQNKYWEYFPRICSIKDTIIANIIITEQDRKFVSNLTHLPKNIRQLIQNMNTEELGNLLTKYHSKQEKITTIREIEEINYRKTEYYQQKYPSYNADRYDKIILDMEHNHETGYMGEIQNMNTEELGNLLTKYHSKQEKITTIREIEEINYRKTEYYQQKYPSYNADLYDKIILDMEHNHETGYMGEAYAYELLIKSKHFKEVIWMSKSERPTENRIIFNNTNYYIQESGEHYDIKAFDYNNKVYYFEVKATQYSELNAKLCFFISYNQIQFINSDISKPNKFFILVSNVRQNPTAMIFRYTQENRLEQLIY